MLSTEKQIHNESLRDISELTFLFRGLRNNDSHAHGNWWTEDSFYALSISGPDGDLTMLIVPNKLLHEYLDDGRAQNRTYRERNTNESEIEFSGNLPLEPQSSLVTRKKGFLLTKCVLLD